LLNGIFFSEFLIDCWLQHLEAVIKARIPSILSNINKNIDELDTEMNQLGRPIAVDAGVSCWLGGYVTHVVLQNDQGDFHLSIGMLLIIFLRRLD